ncbi:MAG: carbohydrate ABC transporter permease [Oscillospiraceae bacterium]|nr:carbohydrate ABC transporter permease [Oscillospiraceae bacterium]
MKLKKPLNFAITALGFLVAALFAVAFLVPTVLTVADSFMTQTELTAKYGMVFPSGSGYMSQSVGLVFIPDKVSFSQYETVLLKSPDYLLKFWNSAILTLPIVAFQLVIAALASYAFTKFRGRVKEIIFFSYIILMLMPYQVTLVPNYLVAKWTGLIDTRWAIILPGVAAPFSVFLLTKFMRRISTSLFEAAKLDGAGEMTILVKICLPMCKSALYSIAILVFIDYWNMVEQPLILLSDETLHPLSIFLSRINQAEVGLAFAVATIYMIPCLFLFLHGETYLVEGITYSGAIKG